MALNDTEQTNLRSRVQFHRRCRAAENSLLEFTRQGWKWVEPGPLDIGWHIECLSEHLEAVAHQQCLRLLINLPPRHMKSLLGNVFSLPGRGRTILVRISTARRPIPRGGSGRG